MNAHSDEALAQGSVVGAVRVVAAAVRGRAHARDGLPCQDAWAYALEDDWVCAAVCDGAGSATSGALGARVGSRILVKALRVAHGRRASDGTMQAVSQGAILDGIVRARRLLARLAQPGDQRALASFHATLVGVVASPQGGCFFHIGDGAAVAATDEQLAPCAVSPPANGRYLDETFFFTEDSWTAHLRLTPFGPSSIILLMSDGPCTFVLNAGQDGVDPGFCVPVIRHLACRSTALGAVDLAETLDSAQAHRLCEDDKTLLVIRMPSGP